MAKTTKKAGQIKEAQSMRIMAIETGGGLVSVGNTRVNQCLSEQNIIVICGSNILSNHSQNY